MKETDLNESDYYIPLVRASGLYDKWKNQDGVNFDTIKSWFQEQRLKYIQMRDTLSSEDVIKERKSASDMLGNIRHEFHYRTNLDARKEQIENNGLSVFSRDLETILDYFVVAEESSYIFNTDTIPSIKGILYSTEMIGALSDNEMENLQKFVKEYMKSVVYGESLYHPDAQKYMSVIGPIKASASALALS